MISMPYLDFPPLPSAGFVRTTTEWEVRHLVRYHSLSQDQSESHAGHFWATHPSNGCCSWNDAHKWVRCLGYGCRNIMGEDHVLWFWDGWWWLEWANGLGCWRSPNSYEDFSRLVPEQSFHCKEGLVAIKNSTLHNPIPNHYVGPWQWRRKKNHPCFRTGLEISRARRNVFFHRICIPKSRDVFPSNFVKFPLDMDIVFFFGLDACTTIAICDSGIACVALVTRCHPFAALRLLGWSISEARCWGWGWCQRSGIQQDRRCRGHGQPFWP